ncbi:helix-turn-helix domain-containing protein [Streptoalloteichus hindustanus]|uniref:helix-turn-helix domain-containing protein n=1 Tax=Streptoalloteichus hindustanus TaxID=2017 RepID=UPI0009361ABE|nr:helix-turn-helix transcriptional regulator [Streptoalloteichus hindustanus]
MIAKIQLGQLLKQYRDQAKLSPEQVSEHMRWHGTKLSRIENGYTGVTDAEADRLIQFYSVPAEDHDLVRTLAADGRRRVSYGHVRTDARAYVGMLAGAKRLRAFAIDTFDGLLQTEDYARALLTESSTATRPVDRDHLISGRMQRQEIILSGNVALEHIVSEAALHQLRTHNDVMQGQLRQLLQMSALPNVTIQVLPFGRPHPAMGQPFTLVDLAQPERTVVYIEGITNSFYPDGRSVETHTLVYDRIKALALSVEDTRGLLARSIEEMENDQEEVRGDGA